MGRNILQIGLIASLTLAGSCQRVPPFDPPNIGLPMKQVEFGFRFDEDGSVAGPCRGYVYDGAGRSHSAIASLLPSTIRLGAAVENSMPKSFGPGQWDRQFVSKSEILQSSPYQRLTSLLGSSGQSQSIQFDRSGRLSEFTSVEHGRFSFSQLVIGLTKAYGKPTRVVYSPECRLAFVDYHQTVTPEIYDLDAYARTCSRKVACNTNQSISTCAQQPSDRSQTLLRFEFIGEMSQFPVKKVLMRYSDLSPLLISARSTALDGARQCQPTVP